MRASCRSKVAARVFRVLLLTLPVLATLLGTAFLVALPLTWISGSEFVQPGHLLLGMVCGLIAWLFLSVFHLKKVTLSIPFKDRAAFVERFSGQLRELGYEVARQAPDQFVSWPKFRSLLFGGGVQARLQQGVAQVTGPKVFVEILRNRLRLETHIARVHQTLGESRQRQGDRLLKRVQISLRFAPERWQEVADEVIDVLRHSGADVLCDLHLLAGSDHGVSEQLIEGPVREWLRRHAIQSEIHKDLAQWGEPGWRHAPPTAAGDTPVCSPLKCAPV